jgi:hypothetical protein
MPTPRTASQFNILHNPYIDNFTSVSGSDIVGVFGHVELLNLQGVSVSVNREIHPIYVMGRVDALSFSRGKRGVAGSIVTVCGDRGALYDIRERYGVYAAKVGDMSIPGLNGPTGGLDSNILDESERLGYTLATPVYLDQLPPFDVTLVGRNDNLAATISRILGIYIVSMGTGISVDDNSLEASCTFVALGFEDWRPAGRTNRGYYEREQERASGAYQGQLINPFSYEQQGERAVQINPQGPRDTLGNVFDLGPWARQQ